MTSDTSEPSGGGLRADLALVERGLAPSRTVARRLVEAGRVRLGAEPLRRASRIVAPDDALTVLPPPDGTGDYVSRAAHKLLGALDALAATSAGAPRIAGRRVLDAGASTGGFTQVALERGAGHVVAVDVGHDQLAAALRTDSRVTSVEGVNVRELDPELVAPAPDLLLADLSFISLTLVLAPLARAIAPGADAIVLVKPQFEVGRAALGKGGVVVDDEARASALSSVLHAAVRAGFDVRAVLPSPVAGEHGNRELIAWLRRGPEEPASGVAEPVPDLVSAAAGAVRGEVVILPVPEPSTGAAPSRRPGTGEWTT